MRSKLVISDSINYQFTHPTNSVKRSAKCWKYNDKQNNSHSHKANCMVRGNKNIKQSHNGV